MGDRCPRCGGSLKPGAQWCGLCYADLRPPPPQPVDAPEPPVFAPVAAATRTSAPPATADDAAARGTGSADAATAEPRKGWPCVECGTVNAFEHEVCVGCGLPFGSALRTAPPSIPGDRRTRIGAAVALVLLLMAIIAVVSAATTEDLPPEPDPSGVVVVEG